MPPELARDPHRQRSVEHRPVERGDRRPALERERAVAGRGVPRRGREHPAGRAAPRARRTCARAMRRAAGGTASARPSAPWASPTCLLDDPDDPLEHARLGQLGHRVRRPWRRAPCEEPRRGRAGRSLLRSPRRPPAGTSRPFSSSWTTSGTPPTAVATTGVPTASASTTLCGRFSQAEVESAASAARYSVRTSSRERGPEKRTRSAIPSAEACRSSDCRSGPSPATTSETSPSRATASSASPRAFWRVRRPAVASVKPFRPSATRASSRAGSVGSAGAGFGTTTSRSAGTPQPTARSRRYALGTTTRVARRSAAFRVARRKTDARVAALRLELVERPAEPTRARRPLEGLVRDELHDQRAPREGRAESRAPDHRRRIDPVGPPRRARDGTHDVEVPERSRACTRDPANRVGPRCGRGCPRS